MNTWPGPWCLTHQGPVGKDNHVFWSLFPYPIGVLLTLKTRSVRSDSHMMLSRSHRAPAVPRPDSDL